MSELRRITDVAGAEALADLLNSSARRQPVVVVTTPAGSPAPYLDADRILTDVGDLAQVYVLTTGPHSWAFSRKMPELTQVYGGAGRAYPPGHAWVANPRLSPLRFAYDAREGERATSALISDTLHMAAAAGLFERRPQRHRRRVEATIAGFPVPERALAKLDGSFATVVQELTIPSVPLRDVVSVGMRVAGWVDSETRRLDLTESLRPPEEALATYAVGDLVPVRVQEVRHDTTALEVYPGFAVEVHRDQVTGNDLDDLRTLLTPGEVVLAHVRSVGPNWQLSLLDVDDDESPRVAVSVLPDGPPWLQPPEREPDESFWLAEPEPAAQLAAPPPAEVLTPPALTPAVAPPAAAPPRPTPAMLDRRRGPRPAPPAPAAPETGRPASPAASSMALTIAALQADVGRLEQRVTALDEELRATRADREDLLRLRADQDRRIARLEHELQVQRSRLRKAKQPAARADGFPTFADPEQGFHVRVTTAWARRIPPAEQPALPLPDYDIGPEFLDSLDRLDGISPDKVADVVVDVVTGRARDLPGRQLHQLRESDAGGSPARRRADGAIAWRVSLQVNTPQARRLHYWQLPGGHIELWHVARHDD